MSDRDTRAVSGDRRRFILGAVKGGGAALAAAALPGGAGATEEKPSPAAEEGGRGYRLTPHVVAYYRTLVE